MKDVQVLQSLLTEDQADLVYECGFATSITQVTLEHIPMLVRAICIHSCIVPIKAELDQLGEGLKLFDVLDLVQKRPILMKELFACSGSSTLTVNSMLPLFEIDYSPEGSNARETEEAAVVHWNEFLLDVENGMAGKFSSVIHAYM